MKRYFPRVRATSRADFEMAESPSGVYVRHSEVVELEQERDELKARVEELEALIKHIYHYGTIMTVDDHKAMMNWGQK